MQAQQTNEDGQFHARPQGLPTLRLRAREEAEKQGYTYPRFYRRCAQVGLIHDTSLRHIWDGKAKQLATETVAKLARALRAEGWPPDHVIGDPNDGKVYLYWWEPQGAYAPATTEALPPEDEGAF